MEELEDAPKTICDMDIKVVAKRRNAIEIFLYIIFTFIFINEYKDLII